jgi:hypothetical protein
MVRENDYEADCGFYRRDRPVESVAKARINPSVNPVIRGQDNVSVRDPVTMLPLYKRKVPLQAA